MSGSGRNLARGILYTLQMVTGVNERRSSLQACAQRAQIGNLERATDRAL